MPSISRNSRIRTPAPHTQYYHGHQAQINLPLQRGLNRGALFWRHIANKRGRLKRSCSYCRRGRGLPLRGSWAFAIRTLLEIILAAHCSMPSQLFRLDPKRAGSETRCFWGWVLTESRVKPEARGGCWIKYPIVYRRSPHASLSRLQEDHELPSGPLAVCGYYYFPMGDRGNF